MSKLVEINGESLLELIEPEKDFMKMFIQCINIKDSKYKLWNFEDINLYTEFINTLKEITGHVDKEATSLEALEYGKWYPIEEYYKRMDELDWALVQFKETKTGFMPLPYRAEYIKRDGVWTTQSNNDRYLCELCEPVAFMLWQPYEEGKNNG